MKTFVEPKIFGEPKIYQSFPINQSLTESFHEPFRLDVSDRSGGTAVYGKSCLISQQLKWFKTTTRI